MNQGNQELEKTLQNRGYHNLLWRESDNVYKVILKNQYTVWIKKIQGEYELSIFDMYQNNVTDKYREYQNIYSLWTLCDALDRLSNKKESFFQRSELFRHFLHFIKVIAIIIFIILLMGLILPAMTF